MTLKEAVSKLREELHNDREPGGYYSVWQANLATVIYDAFPEMEGKHEYSNLAAVRFLERLINFKD